MHTLTIVLIPADVTDHWLAATEKLEQHRIIENDDDPSTDFSQGRLDYWTIGNETIADAMTAEQLNLQNHQELVRNVCFVSRLKADFLPGAVVTPDGLWHDIFDHGWKLVQPRWSLFGKRDRSNEIALASWKAEVQRLFELYPDHLAVEFDTHS